MFPNKFKVSLITAVKNGPSTQIKYDFQISTPMKKTKKKKKKKKKDKKLYLLTKCAVYTLHPSMNATN